MSKPGFGLASLLGAAGVAKYQADAVRIVRAGRAAAPPIVLLAEHRGGHVSWLATTVEAL